MVMTVDIYTNGQYLENNPTWDIEDSPWKAIQIQRLIERNHLNLHSICEVGCGAGEVLRELQSQLPNCIEFVGYEISPQAYSICQKKENSKLKFCHQDLLSQSVYFDLLLCIDVIEHVDNYLGFLSRLKPLGNYKIFHIPLEISVLTILKVSGFAEARRKVGHLHYFTKELALQTLETANYQILDYCFTAGAIDLPRKSLKTVFANIPRKLLYSVNPDFAVRLLSGYSLLVLAQ
jgi:SAM-dependent methyltransferase